MTNLEEVSIQTTGLGLGRNFSWAFVGNAATAVSQFGMLVTLTRFGNAEMTGQYALGLAITVPLFVFASFSLRNIQVTDQECRFSGPDYWICYLLGVGVGMAALSLPLTLGHYTGLAAMVIVVMGVVQTLDMASDLMFGVMQREERMDLISLSLIFKAVASVATFALILYLGFSLLIALGALVVVGIVRLWKLDLPNYRRISRGAASKCPPVGRYWRAHVNPRWTWNGVRSLLVFSMPLTVSTVAVSLINNIPRYALERTAGTEALGIFTVLSFPLLAGAIVMGALSQAALPKLSKYRSQKKMTEFNRFLLKLLAFAGGLAVVALAAASLFGQQLVEMVFGITYASPNRTLILLVGMMGVGFLNWFLNSGLVALLQFRMLARLHVVTLAATIFLSLIIVPRAGMVGAAAVGLLVMTVQVVTKGVLVARYAKQSV